MRTVGTVYSAVAQMYQWPFLLLHKQATPADAQMVHFRKGTTSLISTANVYVWHCVGLGLSCRENVLPDEQSEWYQAEMGRKNEGELCESEAK